MRSNIVTFDQKIKIDNTVLHFLHFIVLQIELLVSPGKFLHLQGNKKNFLLGNYLTSLLIAGPLSQETICTTVKNDGGTKPAGSMSPCGPCIPSRDHAASCSLFSGPENVFPPRTLSIFSYVSASRQMSYACNVAIIELPPMQK